MFPFSDNLKSLRPYPNSHLNDASIDGNDWMSSFTVKKNWNYRSILKVEKLKRPKINATDRKKKVKMKKPLDGIPRSKKNYSSLCGSESLKKRATDSKNSSTKNLLQSYREKVTPDYARSSTINGLISDEIVIVSRSKQIQVPNRSPVRTSNDLDNLECVNVADEEEYDVDMPEYPQYVELKPSVKFKCYRCGMNDFSTMVLLREHVRLCNGKSSSAIMNHSSSSSMPVRTTKDRLISAPLASPNLKITRKVFLCSSCGTYYQNYNLYIHMRDKHNKQICLYCRNIFARSDQLWDHLANVHNLKSVNYSSASDVRNAFRSSFYITCCSCNSIFSNDDRFNEHNCEASFASNDVTGGTADAKDSSICLGCKSKDETEAVVGAEDHLLPFASLSPVRPCSSPQKSVCSADEAQPDASVKKMSPESALDIIGLSENRAVMSLVREEPITSVNDLYDSEYQDSVPYPNYSNVNKSKIFKNRSVIALREYVERPVSEEHPVTSLLIDNTAPELEDTAPIPEDTVSILEEPLRVEDAAPPFTNIPPLPKDTALPFEGSANKSDIETAILKIEKTKSERSDKDETSILSEPITVNIPDSRVPINNMHPAWNEETKSVVLPDEQPPENGTLQPLPMALMLDDTVASLSIQALIKECVRTSCLTCLYCSNATIIAVHAGCLVSHLLSEHRYMPTKNEDDSQRVVEKLESSVNDLSDVYMNASHSSHEDIAFDGSFACLQCSFSTPLFKDLCHHKRRTHHKIIFLCIMCKCNFLFYSQLLCHLCPGRYSPETQHSLNYHCCFCNVNRIPSAFRLMVHLRKVHQACDVCLAQFADQYELHSHMMKQHKISHLCYKCNLAWRSRDDISKHLFWKHGTESVLCKRCLQKKWPHSYHFCIPASTYTCEECSRMFTKAVALTVHRRAHNGEFPFACTECEQRCISKRLLALHRRDVHHVPLPQEMEKPAKELKNNGNNERTGIDGVVDDAREEEKSRRKKKRKKTKMDNEKPLLDELPPLNLSSESDDESLDDENNIVATRMSEVTRSENSTIAAYTARVTHAENITVVADSTEVTGATNSAGNFDTTAVPSIGSYINSAEDSIVAGTPVDANISIRDSGSVAADCTPSAEDGKPQETPAFSLPSLNEVQCEMEKSNPVTNDKTKKTEKVKEEESFDDPAVNAASVTMAEKSIDIVEKMLNCLIIEHSYCIPDSIFHTEMANHSAVSESSDNANKQSSSPKPCTKRDRVCKSIMPRKRKRPSKRKSSSSDSSSDSDSSSSSCGSNCSCNRSACSSSSSSESTTPEKSLAKQKTIENRSATKEEFRTDVNEQHSLLNVPESDLETEIATSDEDFYEVQPYIPPSHVIPPLESSANQITCPTFDTKIAISKEARIAAQPRGKKNRKRKKKPRITINLGQIQRNSNAAAIKLLSIKPIPSKPSVPLNYGYNQSSSSLLMSTQGATLGSNVPNCVNVMSSTISPFSRNLTPSIGSNNSGRLSKRKRVKNKFYGYSSSDEGSTNESSKTSSAPIRRRAPQHKRPSKLPFVGIQIKKPLLNIIPPKPHSNSSSSSTMSPRPPYSLPSRPTDLYRVTPVVPPAHLYPQCRSSPAVPRPDSFRQQHGFAKPFLPHSSDESSDDSDERRHTLVINLPNPRQKKVNNSYQPPQQTVPSAHYLPSSEDRTPDTWTAARSVNSSLSSIRAFQQHLLPTPNKSEPTKSEIYCFCKCPYDEVSEMIACDGPNCPIEWFHFDCVGIMVPPKGKWFCPECRKNRENVTRFFD